MLRTILTSPLSDDSSRANLEDLRQQLVARLVLLLVCTGGFLAWALLVIRPFPGELFALSITLTVLGCVVWALNTRWTRIARHALVWGTTLLLMTAITVIHVQWLPFLGLFVAFANAFLISGSGLFAATAVASLTIWLAQSEPHREYPIAAILIAFVVGSYLSWMVVNTLYKALQWAHTMQRRADELLLESQNIQVELKRTLKSMELANYLIERSNQELVVAREHADELKRMKEQFAANISHEFRTPLNLILGFSEMMYLSPEVYGDLKWPFTLRRDVYQIHRSSVHLLEMIDDILDLSRFEITGFALSRERVDIEPLLRATAEVAAGLLRDRPIELRLDIEPGLPLMDIDQIRIRQVTLNLLSNAQRFTTKGTICLGAKRESHEVIIRVQDTGTGIPEEKLPHIFEAFYQVDGSLRHTHGGAGLGLTICQRFVQEHDGRIWVESKLGEGSTFFVALPIPGVSPPVSRPRMVNPHRPTPQLNRPKVLIVDPDPSVAALLSRHVKGYEVVHIHDTEHLDENIALHAAEAVILNVQPAGTIRTSLTHQTRYPDVPIFECSLPSQSWIANDLSVAACLTKPVTAKQLLNEIGKLGPVKDVLVVDDDQGFCELIERMLTASDKSYFVSRTYDGQQGLRYMLDHKPDLVITDLAMPGMDGFEMVASMRSVPELKHIPVILTTVTSYAEDTLRHKAGHIIVEQASGLQTKEVLRCIGALLEVLGQHHESTSDQSDALQGTQNVITPDRLTEVLSRTQ